MREKIEQFGKRKFCIVISIVSVLLVGAIVMICVINDKKPVKTKSDDNTVNANDIAKTIVDTTIDVNSDMDHSVVSQSLDVEFQHFGMDDAPDDIKVLSDVTDENRVYMTYTATNKSGSDIDGYNFCKVNATDESEVCDFKTFVKINGAWTGIEGQTIKDGETYEFVAIGSRENLADGYVIYFYNVNGDVTAIHPEDVTTSESQ